MYETVRYEQYQMTLKIYLAARFETSRDDDVTNPI